MKTDNMMNTKKYIIVLTGLFLSLTLLTCTNNPGVTDSSKSNQDVTDYSIAGHWLSLPNSPDKAVDVFYLYPTSWQKISPDESNICKIDNPIMLKYSLLALLRQATAFSPSANIYAPYYRQMDIASRVGMTSDQQEAVVGAIPTGDAVAAFDYYIKHYNHGRPFILAGHSQGANITANILSGYMKEHPEVYVRMIAAYVIGYSITSQYLAKNPYLKFAEGPNDTGVIISFNTEAPDVVPGTNPVTLPGGIAINPITWTRNETLASASQNAGSIMLKSDASVVLDASGNNLVVKGLADARVDKA